MTEQASLLILKIQDLWISYGPIRAVRGVSLQVADGELAALLGANGAGKTSTLRSISGVVGKAKGTVTFAGRDISRTAPHTISKLGLAHVPEGRQVFAPLTVAENLDLGAYGRGGADLAADIDRVFQLFPVLADRRGQIAGSLSGGEQQMLAFARALMARPKLILMDEPSMGLAPITTDKVYDAIQAIHNDGVGILLVEQSAERALEVASRVYVMERGEIALAGSPKEVAADPRFVSAYLGPAVDAVTKLGDLDVRLEET
jgi:branched-chain amino acid transport system ATP-binding protein